MFLSKAERDYLSADLQISDGYCRTMRSRLHKKVQAFVNQELPLLIEKGYVTEFRNVTENSNALVGRSAERRVIHERARKGASPWRDLNARPKVYETFF
jgi:hypothetical protein